DFVRIDALQFVDGQAEIGTLARIRPLVDQVNILAVQFDGVLISQIFSIGSLFPDQGGLSMPALDSHPRQGPRNFFTRYDRPDDIRESAGGHRGVIRPYD